LEEVRNYKLLRLIMKIGGLINNQIIVFITNLIIPFLVQLINIPYIMNSIQRTRERAKGKLSTMTQQEANK
jgi:hypothetical protein